MKEIRIFLASSYELEPDRARIGDLIRQFNEVYEEKFIHLHLVKWEDLNSFYNPLGKQFEYDFHIEECELFIGLFWHGVGRHTKHEVVIARAHLPAENILIFRKTAEYQKDHEGSEDQKRYIERHPDEDLKLHQKEFDSFLEEQKSIPYKNYGELRQLLSEKIKRFSETIEITEEEKVNRYSSRVLQIHVAASPEAESDLVRLGDLIRYLDENNKFYSRIRLIPEIPGSDMFVALCHSAAPPPVPEKIQSALDLSSDNDGKPRIYFCMKYVADDAKEESLKELESRLSEVLKHYPDRYTQSSEMKLHFLLQLENLKRGFDKISLMVENGIICQKVGENKIPLMFCEDMLSLQKDAAYQRLKTEQRDVLANLEKLHAESETSEEDLTEEIQLLDRKLGEIRSQIEKKQNVYFRIACTLDEMVGKEQDEEIETARELVMKGRIDDALLILPGTNALQKSYESDKRNFQRKALAYYYKCSLRIDCLLMDLRKNQDEISELYELQIEIAVHDLQNEEKVAETFFSYASCLEYLCRYDRALEYYGKALAICKNVLGEEHQDTATCYRNIGNILSDKGDYAKALEYLEKSLATCIKILGEEHQDTAACYINIGNVLSDKGEYAKALEYYGKALVICKKVLGEEHLNTTTCYINIGNVWSDKGEYAKALEYYGKALTIRNKILGEEHQDTATCYINIGNVWSDKGEYAKALEYYGKALTIRNKVLGEEHPNTATCYNNIGNILSDKGDYARALEYYGKALAVRKKVLGEEHQDTAACYINIGNVLSDKGDYAKALEYYGKALAIRKKVLGEDHPETATCYINVGNVLYRKGEYAKALEYYGKALVICKKVLGEDHPETAACYNNIGSVLSDKGDYAKALEYYGKVLASRKKVLGEDHPDTCKAQNNIGNVLYRKGEYAKTLEYYGRALAIFKKVLGEDHPDTADCYNNIGSVLSDKGEYAKALEYYGKALAIFKKVLGAEHPDTRKAQNNIERIHRELEQIQYSENAEIRAKLNACQEALETASSPDEIADLYSSICEIHEEAHFPEFWLDADRKMELAACIKALKLQMTPEKRMGWYRRIGALYRDLREPQPALAAYDDAIRIIDAAGITTAMAGTVYNEAGHIRFGQQDFEGALRDCRKALQILRDNFGDGSPAVRKTERFIQEIREKLGEDPADQ